MSRRAGLLMVMMEPPPPLEEEFNAWYDTEHLPERIALPGFRSGARFVALTGYPRYMALYDLDGEDVLDSAHYQAISGPNFSPWTKRVTSRMHVRRIAATQVFPGDAVTGQASRLMVLQIRPHNGEGAGTDLVAALKALFEGVPEAGPIRLFETAAQTPEHYAIVELMAPLAKPVDFAAAGGLRGRLGLCNVYASYGA